MPPKDRERLGISDALIRVSVGLEAAEDLIEDFRIALSRVKPVRRSAAARR